MQYWCTDLVGELDRKGKRKKIWKEWDKSTLCCTNWLDPLPGPTYEEEGPEVVGWFSWFLFNKSPSSTTSIVPISNVLDQITFPSEPEIQYMAC